MPNPRKDNVDLICSIGELAGLFEKSTSLEDFLQTVVQIVAYHMRAAVCSVYLYDEVTQELVLTANQGLEIKTDIRLKLGEGLTGTALKELRPIREGNGPRNPEFKFIPGIREENYQAFLAVPILRGITRIGVLVLQDPVTDYFEENDTKALQAIAAQLATTIENAKLLMALHHEAPSTRETLPEETVPAKELKFISGKPAARGHARGRPFVFGETTDPYIADDPSTSIPFTEEDFLQSLERTELQLETLQLAMQERLADVASMIFSAHILMVKDTKFSGAMLDLIRQGVTPPRAINQVVRQYSELFSGNANPRLREKAQDVQDLGRRLLRNLRTGEEVTVDYDGDVVIASELLPSDVLKLSAQNTGAIIQVGGAAASHIAILARSLGLPMVVVDEPALFDVEPDVEILVDGDQGHIHINPDETILNSYAQLEQNEREAEARAAMMKEETWTRDRTRVWVLANINMLSELSSARRLKAEGIGLYRSEFPFIVRNNFPSEEEQFRVYRLILDGMEGREVVFRTLDVGGDKMLSYFPGVSENNPFLGLRAIRFSFRFQDIFFQQLRALLRAGEGARLKIMFPMISSVDDFIKARELVRSCSDQLKVEGVSHNMNPELGAMIELPAAVEVANELAMESDFLSIGGNDLVQYMLAVDRTNQQISDLYVSHHPAVLRALKRVADAALAHDTPVSFCGEMATDARMLPFLLGIGIRRFSVESRSIPSVHETIESVEIGACEAMAKHLLTLGRIAEVDAALEA